MDEDGVECITLQRCSLRVEITASLPSPPWESTSAILYAHNGDLHLPELEILGFEVVVGRNETSAVDVCPDRFGKWDM